MVNLCLGGGGKRGRFVRIPQTQMPGGHGFLGHDYVVRYSYYWIMNLGKCLTEVAVCWCCLTGQASDYRPARLKVYAWKSTGRWLVQLAGIRTAWCYAVTDWAYEPAPRKIVIEKSIAAWRHLLKNSTFKGAFGEPSAAENLPLFHPTAVCWTAHFHHLPKAENDQYSFLGSIRWKMDESVVPKHANHHAHPKEDITCCWKKSAFPPIFLPSPMSCRLTSIENMLPSSQNTKTSSNAVSHSLTHPSAPKLSL